MGFLGGGGTSPTEACARTLPLAHAFVLGLLHGPTELLPVSSSAHTALLPRLLGWPAAELDPELGKSLALALHCGAAVGLSFVLRRELSTFLRRLEGRQAALLALSLAPPAAVGYALERPIERRLGGPRTIAFGLAGGGLAMALADLLGPHTRLAADATPRDGLSLGLAQALALVPGVSRNGATLTAARALGFRREDSQALSWRVALPVILGAGALKARRLSQRGLPAGLAPALTVGACAALLSTLACAPLIAPGRRARSLLPFSLYRLLLAALAIRRS